MPRARIPTTSPRSRLERPGGVRLVSCYELGHQPLAVASAKAFLERAGFQPVAHDLTLEPLERCAHPTDSTGPPELFAIAVPMHTALHIGVRAAEAIRRRWPDAHVCFFGLYAHLNADWLLEHVADSVIGGEVEGPLVELCLALADGRLPGTVEGVGLAGRPARPNLARLAFPPPSREGLAPVERYAHLAWRGVRYPAAAVEASRGCLHHCRHCPIPPVYGGRFFVVPREVVLADAERLARSGVRHLTFADPDFFNGPGHTMAVVRELHARLPGMTFDVTTKIENVLRHRDRLAELADCGCVFLVSAVESLSDVVLGHLDKGHTRDDVFEALAAVRAAGIEWRPSLVPFTPWATIEDYLELLEWIASDRLVDNVDPVQLSIRLLVPPGSLLETTEAMRIHLRRLAPERFSHEWAHPDPRMDRLHERVTNVVRAAAASEEPASATFARIAAAAADEAGVAGSAVPTRFLPARASAAPPRLTEPWFC